MIVPDTLTVPCATKTESGSCAYRLCVAKDNKSNTAAILEVLMIVCIAIQLKYGNKFNVVDFNRVEFSGRCHVISNHI
jgi:hypothetical protein